jgi:hypothetical protein
MEEKKVMARGGGYRGLSVSSFLSLDDHVPLDQMPFPSFTSANVITPLRTIHPQPKVLPALALQQLLALFPAASPAFLEWCLSYHLANSSSHPKSALTVERIVSQVSEKIVDGLGDLYPRAFEGKRKRREEREVGGLNEQL